MKQYIPPPSRVTPPAARPPGADASGAWLRRMRPALGTYVEVAACAATPAQADRATEAAFGQIHRAQTRWSFHDPDSELSRLNRQPGCPLPVTAATGRLLRLSRALMRLSHGAFDVTVGGRLIDAGHLPAHPGMAWLQQGEAGDIVLGPDWAMLARPVRLVLDGIAKGFAVDLAVRALRAAGASAGWVNAGGDLRTFGDVTVPIRLRAADGMLHEAGGLRCGAIATSAVAGPQQAGAPDFPGHIVGTGAHHASPGTWSVLAATAWRADALTKVAACAPPAERRGLVTRLGGTLLGDRP